MKFSEFRQFAESRIATEWTTTPIAFENAPDSDALIAAKNAKDAWVRFIIREGNGALQTIGAGSRLDRYSGALIMSVFVSQASGTRTAAVYADSLSDIWKGYSGQPCVRFGTPYFTVVGETDGWFQINVMVSFQNNEFS